MLENIILKNLIKIECIRSIAIGGSRSRAAEVDEKSDWDIFCLIRDSEFEGLKNNFPELLMNIEDFIVFDYSSFQVGWGFLFYGITKGGIQYDIAILPASMSSYMGIRNTNIILKDEEGLYAKHMGKESASDKYIWENNQKNIERKKNQFLFNIARYINSINKNNYLLAHRYLCALRVDICQLYRIINNIKTDVFEIPEKGLKSGDYIYDYIMTNLVLNNDIKSFDTYFIKILTLYCNITNDDERLKKIIKVLSVKEINKDGL